jgi:hypothetical protein
MIVTKNAVYLHIPKTAGMWFRRVMEPITVSYESHGVPQGNIVRPHTYTLVRNPWSWYVSMYNFLKYGSEEFSFSNSFRPPVLQALADQSFDNFVTMLCKPTEEYKKRVFAIYKIKFMEQLSSESKLNNVSERMLQDPEGIILTEWMTNDNSYYEQIASTYTRHATRIGKYEDLTQELLSMTAECGDLDDQMRSRIIDSPPFNITSVRDSYQSYYTDQTRQLVADTTDFLNEFHYEF